MVPYAFSNEILGLFPGRPDESLLDGDAGGEQRHRDERAQVNHPPAVWLGGVLAWWVLGGLADGVCEGGGGTWGRRRTGERKEGRLWRLWGWRVAGE